MKGRVVEVRGTGVCSPYLVSAVVAFTRLHVAEH